MSDKPLYVCYSLPQMLFLKDNHLRYEVEGVHKTTGKEFWVFIRTEKLNELLKQWSLGR